MAVFTANKPLNNISFTTLVSLLTTAATGGASLSNTTATGFSLTVGTNVLKISGTGITYANIGVPGFPSLPSFKFPIGGTFTSLTLSQGGSDVYFLTNVSLTPASLLNPSTYALSNLLKGSDTLVGSSGADNLSGFAGDDVIRGGGGKDTLDGGGFGGRDKVDYSDKTQGISLTLSMTGSSQVTVGGVVEDTIKNFQDVIGGSGNDIINGDGRENKLFGGAGNDKLFGGAGYDYLSGGDGNDILKSGVSDPFGGDAMIGGNGIDTADYSDMTGAISVNLSVKETGQNLWNEVRLNGQFTEWIAQIENVIGGSGADQLTGDNGRNIFTGGAGNDTLNGLGGLDGASFKDKTTGLTITLKNGLEVAVVISATETDKIINIEDLEGGSGNDVFTGDNLANKLYGGIGLDTLKGGSGDDTLVGGAGNDRLRGDAGIDKFVFDIAPSASAGIDTIEDFAVGQDKIQLSKTAFAALGPTITTEDFLSGVGANLKAANPNQHLIYNRDTGDLFFDVDGSGSAAAPIKFAVLTGSPNTLAFTDFQLV